jgi:tetratricopeptide (TPR) repeat protein
VSEPKLYRTLLAVFLVLVVAQLAPALIIFANGNRLHRLYRKAVAAYEDSDYRSAIRGFETCVLERPRDMHAWSYLGISRFRMDDYAGAVSAFEQLASLREGAPQDYYLLTLAYVRARSEKRLAIGPAPIQLWWGLSVPREYEKGCYELTSCRYDEAAAFFESCQGRMPGMPSEEDVLWCLAISYFHANDFDASLDALNQIAARWEGNEGNEFQAVVSYVWQCSQDEKPALGMPVVFRAYATYQEKQRQKGLNGD